MNKYALMTQCVFLTSVAKKAFSTVTMGGPWIWSQFGLALKGPSRRVSNASKSKRIQVLLAYQKNRRSQLHFSEG